MALGIVLASVAHARAAHGFTISNVGNHEIIEVNISSPGDGDWGPDQLEDEVLDPGEYKRWFWDGNCYQDVRLIFSNEREAEYRNFNTCAYDLTSRY